MTSLSPLHTIGNQIAEGYLLHNKVSKNEAREATIEILDLVGFPNSSKAVDIYPVLDSYSVSSITGGMDAQGEVTVTIKDGETSARGKGSSTDVIIASAKALINALNNLRWRKNHPKLNNPKGV